MPNTNIIEYRKVDDDSIVKDKLPINEEKKRNMFKGTIAISIVYGVFALILIFIATYNSSIRELLFNKFLAFTLIFIVGTILIIFIMLYYIFSYVPVNVPHLDDTENVSCPDYWSLEILDDTLIKNSFDPSYPTNLFKYKCIMDTNIYDKDYLFQNSPTINSSAKAKSLKLSNKTNAVKHDGDGENGNYVSGAVDTKENVNIYKNINSYNANDIKNYLNINSDTLANNIFSNLRNVALLENNYDIGNSNIIDLLDNTKGNVWSKNSNLLSPITWQYNPADANVGIGITTTTLTDNNAIILNWRDLTPEIAYNYGNRPSGKIDTTEEKIRELYLYADATGGYNQLGKITITSNYTDEPVYTMKFQADLKGVFTDNSNVNNNIINTTYIALNPNPNATSVVSVTAFNTNNKITTNLNLPIVQIYLKANYRPASIATADLNTSNIPLLCDELYPSLLASFDRDNNNNNLRCAYSKICGIPWSDLRCKDTLT